MLFVRWRSDQLIGAWLGPVFPSALDHQLMARWVAVQGMGPPAPRPWDNWMKVVACAGRRQGVASIKSTPA